MVITSIRPTESAEEGDLPTDVDARTYREDEQAIRTTARWTMAGAGALAALAVARIPVGGLPDLDGGAVAVWITAGMGLLGSATVVLLVAARVLAAPRPTFHELARREADAGQPGRIRLTDLPDRTVTEILERRSELLGRHDTLQAAYAEFVAVRAAHEAAVAAGEAGSLQRAARQAEVHRCRARAVEAAAASLTLRARWRQLNRALLGCGLLFAASLLTLIYLPNRATAAPPITTPIAVHVRIPPQATHRLGLPPACTGTHNGIAVGGSLAAPTVVISTKDHDCPGARLLARKEITAVPAIAITRP